MSGELKSWRKRLSPSAPRRKDGSCGSSVRGSCLALNLRLNLYGSLSDKTLPQAFEFQPTMEVNLMEVRIHEVFPQLMRLTTHEWHLHPGEHGDQELRRIVVRLGSTFACYTQLRSVVSIHEGGSFT